MLSNFQDVRELIKTFRGGNDRLQILLNIYKSINVSNSLNEAMKHMLTIETSEVLSNMELIDISNTYVDNLLVYIDMVDRVSSMVEDRYKPFIKEKATMAI